MCAAPATATDEWVSLFSGVGGLDYGIWAAGFPLRHHCEVVPFRRAVLERRFPGVPCHDDVRTFKPEWADGAVGIAGGFPCQDLSVAGQRAGLTGERSGLFWEIVRIVEGCAVRPAYLLLENVPGLLSSCSCPGCDYCGRVLRAHRRRGCPGAAAGDAPQLDLFGGEAEAPKQPKPNGCAVCRAAVGIRERHAGTDAAVVFAALANLGYGVSYRVLNSRHFGVPQRRRRVFIVAERDPGPDGAPSILFEPEGGARDPLAVGHPWPGAARAAAVGAEAGSGQRVVLDHYYVEDFEDGTLTSSTGRIDRHPLAVVEVEVAENAATHAAGRRREDDVNLVVEEHYFVAGTEDGTLRANGSEDSTGHAGNRSDQQPMVVQPEPQVFESRVARNGRGAPEDVAPPLKAESGETGKGDGAPLVLGVGCGNCGRPIDEHCKVHLVPCCPGKCPGAGADERELSEAEARDLAARLRCPTGVACTGCRHCEEQRKLVEALVGRRVAFRQHGHGAWTEDGQAETLSARDWRDGTLTMIVEPAGFIGGGSARVGGVGYEDETAPTLGSEDNGSTRTPSVVYTAAGDEGVDEAPPVLSGEGPHGRAGTRMDDALVVQPAVFTKGHAAADAEDDPENWNEDDTVKTLHTMGFPPALVTQEDEGLESGVPTSSRVYDADGEAPTLQSSTSPGRGGSEGPKVLIRGDEYDDGGEYDEHSIIEHDDEDYARYTGETDDDDEEEALAFAWQQGDDSGATGTGRGRSWVARAAPGYSGAVSHSRHDAVQYREVVRRLMPIECERLQALPDNWTMLEPPGPDGKGGTPDGPRYAGIGDAVSSCVGWWVASRVRKKIDWLAANAVR